MSTNDIVGRNVRRFRTERGLSMAELGARAGLAKQTIASIESGRGNPTVDTIERIAATLGVSMRAVLTEMGTDVLHDRRDDAAWRRSGAVRVRPLDQVFGSGYVINALLQLESRNGRAHYPARGRGSLHHCYVLDGEVRLGPVRLPTVASPGDFVRFPADSDHFMEAITSTATLFACTTAPQPTMSAGENWF